MSKSSAINLLLIFVLLLIFFKYSKIKLTILAILIITFTLFNFDKDLRKSVINLTSQTTGVEIEEKSINKALYKPIDKLIYERIFSKWFLSSLEKNRLSKTELFIG